MDGQLNDPCKVVMSALGPRIAAGLDSAEIYGEKNVTLGAFIPEISKLFNCSFIFVKRDGRDVVRSLMDWHNRMFGTIYRECKEVGNLSERARSAAAALPVAEDDSDYSRPRPGPGDIWCEQWADFSRFQMCAWYWSRINEMHLDNVARVEHSRTFEIDYSSPSPGDIMELAEFLGVTGLEKSAVAVRLEGRTNSIDDRIGERNEFPRWPDWSSLRKVQFECIAAETMKKLGYYAGTHVRYCPENYGAWWRQNDGGSEWYQWMYEGRLNAHLDLYEFIDTLTLNGQKVESMLDVGCGLGIGYQDRYLNKRYVGLDLSEKEITWCKENYRNPKHDYIVGDVITGVTDEKFDLVFSQGTIDNSYDMDAYMEAIVKRSKGWIYITAYRGWFEALPEHRYQWVEDTTCFYNDISPEAIRHTLQSFGCSDIEIAALDMGIRDNNPITHETRIVARVGP
ncbi:MAG: SAM-dependent methyltransferase [Gammaproteobacteria bacterium]|jgi:SAM-dependent methyltransferase